MGYVCVCVYEYYYYFSYVCSIPFLRLLLLLLLLQPLLSQIAGWHSHAARQLAELSEKEVFTQGMLMFVLTQGREREILFFSLSLFVK